MGKRILGIDTGTNSLGWAVVDREAEGGYSLIKKGCLIFQEGVKIEKGNESSRASERTAHRALRKSYFRRRLRKIAILKVLIKYSWCPYVTQEALHLWNVKKQYPMVEAFLSWQRTDEKLGRNPYVYRHLCLHQVLDLSKESDRYILGRAFYHLAQRRGFKSNRLDQSEDGDKEMGKVKSGISDLSAAMECNHCVYLADYFYQLYQEKGCTVRIRTRYVDREEHYKREFYAICKKQHLSDEQVKELENALYFQRPLKSQRQGVGKCSFEKTKARCADSHPAYERFRMLCFLNNIKVQGPYDVALRPLNGTEREKIKPLFFRKSKPQFDFEDIAKAIAGRNMYQHIKEEGDRPYKFNFRMSQTVSGCPTTAAFISLFGENYERSIAEQYLRHQGKSVSQMVNDVWNVLYSFPDKSYVRCWAINNLQLTEAQADRFANIRLSRAFAHLSITAIRKILPWLEKELIYPHAVLMAKVPDIVGKDTWEQYGGAIEKELLELMANFNPKDIALQGTLEFCIKDYLQNNFELRPGAVDRLYHPSMIETYPDAHKNAEGIYQLGSPRTNAVRNPMAMRSLHQLRKVINMLLREKVIDSDTEVHIEYARELNDANKRKAIAEWNKRREQARRKYAADIRQMYKEECGREITPTNDDILRFQLWTEQEHRCIYTGKTIGITDFIGGNPKYDIEHTVPRSVGGDSTMENMTLCESQFNRLVKRDILPAHLPNHEEILVRLEDWRKHIEDLRKQMDRKRTYADMPKSVKDSVIQKRHLLRIELDYWQNKYSRFLMEAVPEGFSLRQGAGIGLIGKYAGLYLKSLFHRPGDTARSNVRVIKGETTAEYRKMWGVQSTYERKSRDNHIHHCIDAITIACIQPKEYASTAQYYRQLEEYERSAAARPAFPKPWLTFTEDIKKLEAELLVAHSTPDPMPKRACKRVTTAVGRVTAKGDCARGSLHKDTYYGAIERNGEVQYVVRRLLSSFEKPGDAESIVDEAVREKVKQAIAEKGLKEALAGDIYMNREKGILIKKVRCYAKMVKRPIDIRQHRDVSRKEYKRAFHVMNDDNYLMAIYEGTVKGKTKREYELVRMIDAARFYKESTDRLDYPTLVPIQSKKGFPLKHQLKVGQMVLLYENTPEEIDFDDRLDLCKRLYKITGLSLNPTGPGYGVIVMRYHQEARKADEIKSRNGAYHNGEEHRPAVIMLHTQFNALVEGEDFAISALGDITKL